MPGGEVSWPVDGGRGALRAVEELLVELGAARVVVRGDCTYWQGISREQGHACGDKSLISCERL